ncbi:hypothetical protein GCM10027610_051660 [Dactylosporangium cerinum]
MLRSSAEDWTVEVLVDDFPTPLTQEHAPGALALQVAGIRSGVGTTCVPTPLRFGRQRSP